MGSKTKTAASAAPRVLEDVSEVRAIAEIDRQIALPHSVVKSDYKAKYKARAMERGLRGKAAKRSNGDWLAEQMRTLVLDKREKLVVERLVALCEANGLADIETKWPNRNKGWEGRLRMTACLVLRKYVADAAQLVVPGEDEPRIPPQDFIVRNETR